MPMLKALFLALLIESGPVRPEALPVAVQETIQSHLEGGKMGEVTLDLSRGVKTYEAQIIRNGRERTLSVGENGRLVSREVILEETPAAVQKGIKAQLGPEVLYTIEEKLDDAEPTYEVTLEVKGRERAFTFAKDGSLVSKGVAIEEMSPAAQRTIREQVGTGTLIGIDQELDEDPVFNVEASMNGKMRAFSVGSDGALLSQQFDFAELPPAVQKAAQTALGQALLKQVERRFERNTAVYSVEAVKGSKPRELVFGADGSLQSVQVEPAEVPAPVLKTIQQHLEGGELRRIDRGTEDHATIYEVEVHGGHKLEFTVSPTGEYLRGRVRLEQTPLPVRKTILGAIGAGTLLRIDQGYTATEQDFSVQSRKDGREFDFSVDPKGKYLGEDQ